MNAVVCVCMCRFLYHGCQDRDLDLEIVQSRASTCLHRVGALQRSEKMTDRAARRGRAEKHGISALVRI